VPVVDRGRGPGGHSLTGGRARGHRAPTVPRAPPAGEARTHAPRPPDRPVPGRTRPPPAHAPRGARAGGRSVRLLRLVFRSAEVRAAVVRARVARPAAGRPLVGAAEPRPVV